jgi:hypothetical protein
MRTGLPPTTDQFIFGDESSRTAHQYLVVGTVDCPRENLNAITTRLNATLKGRSEYSWNGSLSRDLDHFVDVVFQCIRQEQMWFRCMVVNTHQADHKKYSGGDRDLSLEKYTFVHLNGFARRQAALQELTRFYVELDNRTEKYKGPALMKSLNSRFKNETGHRWEIFADVDDVDSKSQIMVQAADVLAGCVAWVWNEQYKEKHDPKRMAFARKIAELANLRVSKIAEKHGILRRDIRNFGYVTQAYQETKNFTIWRMKMRIEQEKEAEAASASVIAQYPPEMTFAELGQTYHIGVTCFDCERVKADILGVMGPKKLRVRYRPECSGCGEKGFLTIRRQHQPRIRPTPS